MKRQEVYELIDGERYYQDSLWPQTEWTGSQGQVAPPNPLTIGEFVLLMEDYVAQARSAWTQEKKPEMRTLDIVRKVAGIAVNCMEQHGAPPRKQISHQPFQ